MDIHELTSDYAEDLRARIYDDADVQYWSEAIDDLVYQLGRTDTRSAYEAARKQLEAAIAAAAARTVS